jgi:hypothetical protein
MRRARWVEWVVVSSSACSFLAPKGAAAAHAGGLATGTSGLGTTGIISELLSGGVGGSVLSGAVGLIKNKMAS